MCSNPFSFVGLAVCQRCVGTCQLTMHALPPLLLLLLRYEGDYKYYMEQTTWLKEKVERRYVGDGDGICSAKVVNLDDVELEGKKSKSFGGRGGPSGRLFKGKGKPLYDLIASSGLIHFSFFNHWHLLTQVSRTLKGKK